MKLPVLSTDRDALEKCVYCPKLCRGKCPVSNAEPNESLTPWGKMSSVYFLARGDLAETSESAALAWACTDCGACQGGCDHRNDVGKILGRARAAHASRGRVPPGIAKFSSESEAREASRRERTGALAEMFAKERGGSLSDVGLLLGCEYATSPVAATVVRVVEALLGAPVRILHGCCGAPEGYAGDAAGRERVLRALENEVASCNSWVVADPGCFVGLSNALPHVAKPTLLLDLAYRERAKLKRVADVAPIRYHDPCQLGRGLGRYDEPRAILEAITGTRPLEFQRHHGEADCSGGGALLPVAMPAVSNEVALRRIDQNVAEGPAVIGTACASSARRFRASGAETVDLVELLGRSLL